MVSADPKQGDPYTFVDNTPPLPGVFIRREVIDRFGISQADLARLTRISKVRISLIINGHNPMSAEVALRLGQVTKTDPAYWIDLQSRFNLYQKSRALRQTLEKLVTVDAYARKV